jgi:hypothetical protein
MKKTLLIAAAALAASVISSQAQVYSQNIVGYVNQPYKFGYSLIANPLDASDASGINNSVTNLINGISSSAYDGAQLYVWNGAGYTIYTIDSSWPTLIGNAADSAAVTPPVAGSGKSIYINNNIGSDTTNTYVGVVHVDAAASGVQVVGSTTNVLVTGISFYSSKLPVGGALGSVLGFPALSGSLDGSLVYVPNISGTPQAVHGYTIYTVDSSWTTGFGNAADSAQAAEPVIPVGGGFILNNNSGAPVNWVQSL